MTTPSTSQSQLPPQKAGPMDLIAEGLAQNSTAIVQQGLDIFASCRGGLDYSALYETLTFAVGSGKPDIVRYLLDRTDAKVEYVSFEQINMAMSTSDEEPAGKVIEVMEVLVEKGWDINRSGRGGRRERQPLIHHVFWSVELLHWCLDHGARVDYTDTGPEGVAPLLDYVGGRVSISTFKLLMEAGAKMGRRTLHLAVANASSGSPNMMEMVRFLVEEMGCDVNGKDMPEDKRYPLHFGTPINYAARAGAVEVMKYLLEKGANPETQDCWEFDAFVYAKIGGKLDEGVLELLTQWKEQKEKVTA